MFTIKDLSGNSRLVKRKLCGSCKDGFYNVNDVNSINEEGQCLYCTIDKKKE